MATLQVRFAMATLVRGALAFSIASSSVLVPFPSWSQVPAVATADLTASAQASVAQALFAASATMAAAERAADGRISQQRQQIEGQQAQLKALVVQTAELQIRLKAVGGRDLALQRQLVTAVVLADERRSQLAAEQDRFVGQLARRDRAYAQEIAVFRQAVQDIASTPEGEAALRQFNAGDEVGALAVLDRLVDARERGRQVRANVETAAERRRVATLALEARARGKLDTRAVIGRFEAVTRLDPGVHWDWVELGRLYRDTGRLADARRASQRAAETAGSDRDRSVALNELGNVLVAQGDLAGARGRYQESLEIRRRLTAVNPNSAVLQHDVSVSLDKLGDVLVEQGDLGGARVRYQESSEIVRRLVAADASSAALQRGVSLSLSKLGDVLVAQGNLAGARGRYQESLEIVRRLAAADTSSAALQRDVSVSLSKLGDVFVEQGDLAGARGRYQESSDIFKRLSAANPSSAALQRGVSVSLSKLGDVLVEPGALGGAQERYLESSEIDRRLATADPSSAIFQRDVLISMVRLTRFPDSGVTWQHVVDTMEAMQTRGALRPADARLLEEARRQAQLPASR